MSRFPTAAGVLAALSLATPGAAAAHAGPWHWSFQKVMNRIDEKRITVEKRVVRIDSETTLCTGLGPAVRQRRIRTWKHFACTYSVFVAGGGIYDCDFRVHVLGTRKYVITNASWTSGPPEGKPAPAE